MIELFWGPLIGAVFAVALQGGIEYWNSRGRRRLFGEWFCAVQPVYYRTQKWHVQRVSISSTFFGVIIRTIDGPGKLAWELRAKLYHETFLVGHWRSLRSGATSNGYMALQMASNGEYMFGHDYGALSNHERADYGVLLLGRTREQLDQAWNVMHAGSRRILPLDEQVDFPNTDKMVEAQEAM